MRSTVEEDEAYLIAKSKPGHGASDAEAKAWALTAKSLIPRNFALLHEAYCAEKASRNAKESAKIFSRIFIEFPNEPQFWTEAKIILSDIESGTSPLAKFHAEQFSHINSDVQQQILLQLAQGSDQPITQAKLTLILFKKYPLSVSSLWQKVVERLTVAESSNHLSPCNGYRKVLVHDLLPVILQTKGIEISQAHLLSLFQKAIEFYVCYLAKNDLVIKELDENESKLENPIQSLTMLLAWISGKLGWKLCTEAIAAENKAQLCQILWSVCSSVTPGEKTESRFVELYYYTVFTLFKSLFEYLDVVGPKKKRDLWSEMPQVLLVHNLFCIQDLSGKTKSESPGNPVLLTTPKQQNTSRKIKENFAAAISCWELLHNFEELRQQFAGLYESLRITSWPWFQTFMVDVLLYRSLHEEAAASLNHLLVVASGYNKLCLTLKLASVLYISGKKAEALTHLLHLVPQLMPNEQIPSEYFELTTSTEGYSQRVLTFMSTHPTEVLRFITSLILSAYNDIGFGSCSDVVLGNTLVLSQYDWPRNAHLSEMVLDRIRSKNSFKYPILHKYFINVEVMEELMLMASEHGGSVLLEIFPNISSQARISTRGGNRESKEDFKIAMCDLVSQSRRPVYDLLKNFLAEEKTSIIESLK